MQLLRQRAGREGEVFVVGQAVVDSAVGGEGTTFNDMHWGSVTLHLQAKPRLKANKQFCTQRKQKRELLGK